MARTEDRLVCRDVNLVSQVLCLHLTLLLVKRRYIGTQALLVGIHMAYGVVVVVLREVAGVPFCLLVRALGVVLSMDVH